ncbi:hypothetical protein D3C76_1296260 [compost metagenome]
MQAFAQGLAVDRGNHDMAMARFDRAVDQHQVTVEDPGTLHAVAVYPDQVHVRRPQVEQLVQRDGLLHVVRRRRREPRRNAKQVARQRSAAAGERPQDGSHVAALHDNCIHIQ